MSSPTLVYILLVALLLVIGIIFLYVIIKKARREPGKREAPAMLVAGEDGEASQAAQLSPYTSNAGLRLSFIKAMKRIRAYASGKDARYRIPWYLLLGESQSGKTTLLGHTGLNLLFDVPGEKAAGTKQGVNWFFFDQGIVLDVAGDYVLRADGETSDGKGWNYLNRLLKRYRPERPLDGIILTIPCSDLAGGPNMSEEGKRKLEQKAQNLYTKLVLAQKTLGLSFPVYVLVTKCDQIKGFRILCREVPEHLDEMFGWSSPYTREIAYRAEWVKEAFQNLYLYLFQLQIEVFAERNNVSNGDDLFMLPSEMRAMRLPLQLYLDRIFKESAYHDSFFLRGIYFCGDSNPGTSNGSEAPVAPLAQESTEQEIAWLLPPPTPARPLAATRMTTPTTTLAGKRPAFLGHLFERKIFQEDLLARPINRTMLSRNRLVLAAQLLSLAIPLVGILGVLLTYPGLKEREREFYRFLTIEKEDLEAIQVERETGTTDARAQNREARLFEAMSSMSGKGLISPFIPTSWFSEVDERSGQSISDAYHYVIFESLRRQLDCQTESKLFLPSSAYASCYASLDVGAEQAKPLINCGESDPNINSVNGFIGSIGELIQNRERYDRLIQDNGGSLDDLNKLLVSLHHAPLPSQFDSQNNLFAQALKMARGAPLQSSNVDVKERAACKAKGMIQEVYENSLNAKGVSYIYLSDISKAEALLALPDNAWLATRTFDDKRAAFHGLTILAALGELKRALNDLSRQKFMPRDSELEPRAEEDEPEPERQHAARKIVIWDTRLLQQAIALYQDYATFVGNSSYANADTLDRRVKQAALDSLTNKIEALVRRAYRVQTPQRMVGASASRANLDAELANFKQAQSHLSKLLDISVRLSRDIHLRGAVEGQTASLMRAIDAEFRSEDFYARSQYVSPEVFFSMWSLDQPFHSYAVFGVGNADELEVYLADQRTGIAALGRQYAAPVLNFMAANDIPLKSRVVDWNKVLSQLDKYDNSKPGNTVTVLENFIRVEMNKVSVDNCDALTLESGSASSDYFIQVRNALRRSFYVRCDQLALEKRGRDEQLARESERQARQKREDDFYKSLESYHKIEKRFNDTLAGRFPFSNLPKTEPFEEAAPEAIESFFKLLAENKVAALAALQECEKYRISPKAALEFLDQMEQVRVFFASFLDKKPLYPLFDFALKFRVNESNEVGANQIIDWEFGVAKKKYSYQGAETIGNWGYTDPLTLTMRWANNSPTLPASRGPVLSHMKVNEKTVTLVFNNNWSLLLLLLRHKARGTDFDNGVMGVDIEPYTLKFIVPTMPNATLPANIQQAQPSDLRPREVVAFMRVSLMAPSKKDPLILPDNFPVEAPKLTNRRSAPYQSSGQE